jgi:hypothetical protein
MEIAGKRVVDATRSLHIVISPRDAADGRTKDPAGCAAARAIVRGFREEGVKQARVHLGRVYVEYPNKWVRYKTPSSLRAEIISFDRGNQASFMPGDYTLQKISPADRVGAREAKYKIGGPEATRHKSRKARAKIARVIHRVEGVRGHGANK